MEERSWRHALITPSRIHSSMDSEVILSDDRETARKMRLGYAPDKLFKEGDDFMGGQQMRAKKDDAAIVRYCVAEDIAEIGISGGEDQGLFFDELVNFLIDCPGFDIPNVGELVTPCSKRQPDCVRTIRVHKKFHELYGRWTENLFVVSQDRGVEDAGLDVRRGDRTIFFLHLLEGQSRCKCLQDDIDGCPCSFDTRFSVLYRGIHLQMFFEHCFIKHFVSPSITRLYHGDGACSRMRQPYSGTAGLPTQAVVKSF